MQVVGGKIQIVFSFGFKSPKSKFIGSDSRLVPEAGKIVIRAGYIASIKTVAVTVNGG